jgi:hypothetical protein
MEIPHLDLDTKTLQKLIESFVLREGTDYGHSDVTLSQKVAQVKSQLDSGKAVIVYNETDQSISIVDRRL